jgi:hypothetical protein
VETIENWNQTEFGCHAFLSIQTDGNAVMPWHFSSLRDAIEKAINEGPEWRYVSADHRRESAHNLFLCLQEPETEGDRVNFRFELPFGGGIKPGQLRAFCQHMDQLALRVAQILQVAPMGTFLIRDVTSFVRPQLCGQTHSVS